MNSIWVWFWQMGITYDCVQGLESRSGFRLKTQKWVLVEPAAAPWEWLKSLGLLFLRPKPGRGFLLFFQRCFAASSWGGDISNQHFFLTFSTSCKKLGSKGTELYPVTHKGLKCFIFNSPGTWIAPFKSSTLFYKTQSFFSSKKIPIDWWVMLIAKSLCAPVGWGWDMGDVCGKSAPKNLTKDTQMSSVLI